MRAYRITQAQLDEIYEHPLPDHAYQILSNLTPIVEMEVDDPSVSVPANPLYGLWGDAKEEPAQETWMPDDDRITINIQPQEFFEGETAEYDCGPGSFRRIMEVEMAREKERNAMKDLMREADRQEQAKSHQADVDKLMNLRSKVRFYEGLVKDNSDEIFEAIDSGLKPNLFAVDNLKNYTKQLEQAKAELNSFVERKGDWND